VGYFDSLADSAFKKNPQGEGWLYYPDGILSKGRIVVDKDYKEKLFRFQKRMYMYLFPLGIFYGLGLGVDIFNIYHIVPVIGLLSLVYIRQYYLIKDLPKSDVKLKYKEATAIALKGLPKFYFYLLYILSGCMIVMGLCAPVIFNKPYSELINIILILFGTGVVGLILGVFLQKFK